MLTLVSDLSLGSCAVRWTELSQHGTPSSDFCGDRANNSRGGMAGAAGSIPEVALASPPSSSPSFLQPEAAMDTLTVKLWLGDATSTANATIPCTGRAVFA